ncbi:hypothetical protein Tco_0471199 [Tanacetum coccineum]
MSNSAERAQTPANSAVRNTIGKWSKQATDGNLGKVHQEKLKGVQTRLSYSESSRQKTQTKEKTQLSEREPCDRKSKTKKRRSPSLDTMSRGTRPGQSKSLFSRLRQGKSSSTRQRSPVSTTVFTRLGARDRNVFTRLGEEKRDIRLWLGPRVASRQKHAVTEDAPAQKCQPRTQTEEGRRSGTSSAAMSHAPTKDRGKSKKNGTRLTE